MDAITKRVERMSELSGLLQSMPVSRPIAQIEEAGELLREAMFTELQLAESRRMLQRLTGLMDRMEPEVPEPKRATDDEWIQLKSEARQLLIALQDRSKMHPA